MPSFALMRLPPYLRSGPLLLVAALSSLPAYAVDVVKTWTGSANNALNNVSNWVGGTRPTFPADANTDALLFTGSGTGTINVNVDATAKSIVISGALGYTFGGALPVRLGDTTTGTTQPNSGFFINNATAPLAITTTGGLFFSFGKLEANGSTISVGANTPLDIGNGSAAAGRNLTIGGTQNVTVNGLLTGLGTQSSQGGHLFKQGANTLFLNGSSSAWDGRIFIEDGAVRISKATSLGSTVGDTTLPGGAAVSRLEITGGIALDEHLLISGRDTTAPALVNISGANVLTQPVLLQSGGAEHAFASQAGTLSLPAGVDLAANAGPANLHLQGDGSGEIAGAVGTTGDALSLIKDGLGAWTLHGANDFTGAIQVNAGALNLSTAHLGQNIITVANGATLGVKVTQARSLITGAFSVSGTAGTALAFDLGLNGNPQAAVVRSGALSVNGVVGVAVKGAGLTAGQIPLIDYDGAIGGTGFAGLVLTEVPARVSAGLVEDVEGGRLLLNIISADVPRWTGEVDANWDLNDGTGTGTANWKELLSGNGTRYLQGVSGSDSVIFDDTATGATSVILTTTLTPAAITVNNTTKDYSFTGPGGLAGTGTLTKRGTGKLTLLNTTANTFSGLVTLEAGTLQVGDGVTATSGSLGTGPVQNEATLVFNRPDDYTFAGAISGAGAVTKLGLGTTTLSGNSNFTGPVAVNEGTLKLGNANALGSTAAGVVVAPGASLDLGGQLLPENEVVTVSGDGAGGAGAVVNTGAGGAGVGLKKLIFTAPSSIGGSTRWDVRESPGGVDVAGHNLIKTGTNSIFWHNVGETHLGNLTINGAGSRLVFSGDTTLGDQPGEIRVEPGAQLGLEESTAVHTKPIFLEGATLNASGGTTNELPGVVTVITSATINVAAATELLVSGKITGDGSLAKTTGGILKITSNTSDYTGTTTISAGPLWLGNDTPTGSLPPGDIVNNGNLIVRRTDTSLHLTQNISGTGQLTFGNTNTGVDTQRYNLSGNNTFAGAVTVARGTLVVTSNTALGTGPKAVAIQSARKPSLALDGSAGDLTIDTSISYNTSSDGAGAIINVAGNNVIQGGINLRNGGGGNTRIKSEGGSLTLAGDIISAPDATSTRVLILDGVTENNVVSGRLLNGVGNPTAIPPVAPQNLVVTKEGTGRWTLLGSNTHLGNTTIVAGTLKLGADATLATTPAIEVQTLGTFDVSDKAGGFTLSNAQTLRGAGNVQGRVNVAPGSILTPGTSTVAATIGISQALDLAGGRVVVNLNGPTTVGEGVNDLINTGDLSISAPTTLELAASGTLLSGSYRVVNYTGGLAGDWGTVTFINPTRYALALDTTTPGQVNLVVGGSLANLVWSGNGTTNTWDLTTGSSWSGADGGLFFQTDTALFDDTAVGTNTTVNLTQTLYPSAVVVSASQNYTFQGSGSLAGVTGLTKSGTGILTINTVNSFTGKVKVAAGTLLLGATGRLNGTRWIEVDSGATLDVEAIVAGFTLGGGVTDARVLNGHGTLKGNWLVNSAGVVRPGDSSNPADALTAGDGIGSLNFTGNLTLAGAAAPGAPRAVFRLAGPTAQVENSLDSASVQAFGTTLPVEHDHILVGGALTLDSGSTIKIELAEGYVPELGDVFNLLDWTTANFDANADATGFNTALAADLELPALPTGLFWNRGLFASDGLLYISPEPPVVGEIQVSPGTTVNPGVQATFSVSASGLEPFTYQWKRNNQDIDGATNSTLVVTAIEALEGTYTVVVNNPAGPTSSTPVVFTVNNPVGFVQQPQPQTANPGADVTLSVTVSGTGPFTYQWRKNQQPIPDEDGSTLFLGSLTEGDEASYDVIVSNIVGPETSEPAQVLVNNPVVIVTPPVPTGGVEGGAATFTVAATGTGPFTYRWIKNGVDIPGQAAAQASYTLNGLLPTDEGDYSVRVSNVVGSQTSTPVPLLVGGATPKIVSVSPARLASQGSTVTLSVNAAGAAPLKYQWYRGTAKLAGATSATLSLPNIQLKDAGAYKVEVTSTTTATSPLVEVGVVDTTARRVPVALGGTVKLEAKTAGNGLTHLWLKSGEPLAASTRITGVDKTILNIGKPLEDADSAPYVLRVTGPGGTLDTLGHTLQVFGEAPVITEDPPVFPAAIVGGTFSYTIPVDPDPKKAPVSFTATGLPPGLKIDGTTGVISGKPTAVSKGAAGYLVKLTAINPKGKPSVTGRLLVQAFPDNAVGTYAAPLPRQSGLNGGLGGLLELTSTKTGTFTGKLTLGTTTLPLAGALDATPGSLIVQGSQTLARKGLPSLQVSWRLDASNHLLTLGALTDGTDALAFTGWRNKWSKTTPATADFGGYHAFALEIAPTYAGNVAVPQGNGFGSFTVAADGKLTLAGKLADGEALTGATFIGPEGQIAVFRTLYTTKDKGSVAGALDINTPALSGALTWWRPANPAATHRLYKAGFPAVLDLSAVGGRYNPPSATQAFLNLAPGAGNAVLSLAEGGVEGSVAAPEDLDIPVGIALKGKTTLPANATANPRKPTLTLTEKTGAIKGGFTLEDANPVPGGKPAVIKRTVTFEGIAVPEGAALRSYGFFLLPELPAQGGPALTPTRSGQVVLEPASTTN